MKKLMEINQIELTNVFVEIPLELVYCALKTGASNSRMPFNVLSF